MGINLLTARHVQTLKAPGLHADGGGLYLAVSKTGSKSWRFVFRRDGKRHEMGLGSTSTVSLAQAREARDLVARQVAAGLNPIEERRKAGRPIPTFADYARRVHATQPLRNPRAIAHWIKSVTEYLPGLQDLAVSDVTTSDVIAALEPHWSRIPDTAQKIRGRIELILDAARVAGEIEGPWENPARWRGHLALVLPLPRREVRHFKAMPYDQIGTFMRVLRRRVSMSAKALEWTILTAARTRETLGATWSEIDFQRRLWTVPPERMKGGRIHRVPLSDAAMRVLKDVTPKGAVMHPSALIFPNPDRGGPLSNMAMDKVLRVLKLDVTVHGFRSTFKDWAEDATDFSNGSIEAALAHVVGDRVERAYRRGDALEKRRALMQAWADHCAVIGVSQRQTASGTDA